MDQLLTNKLYKYLVQGGIIYLLFKYVPNEPMNNNDILILTTIIIMLYAIIENFIEMHSGKSAIGATCNSYCSNKEHFEGNQINDALSQMGNSVSSGSNEDLSFISDALSEVTVTSQPAQKVQQMQPVQPQVQPVQQPQVQPVQNIKQEHMTNQQNAQQEHMTNQQNAQQEHDNKKTVSKKGGYIRNQDGSYTLVGNTLSETPFAYNFNDYNSLPMSEEANKSFEYGYSFLPPANWYPTPPVPPVCIPTGPTCPVCPIYTEGTNIDLKEWKSSLSVTAPENIHVELNQ